MILDASVAAKWFLKGEAYEPQALRCREDFEAGSVDLSAPALIRYEVANAIWKRKDIKDTDAGKLAERAVSYLNALIVEESPHLPKRIIHISRTLEIPYYDSTYLALTEQLQQPLLTADKELLTKAREKFKIQHLSEYPTTTKE